MSKLKTELNGAIERLNNGIEQSGYYLRLGHRNGYTALDLHVIETGAMKDNFLAGLTDRQALNTVYSMCKAVELNHKNPTRNNFFINDYDRIFTVKLACGIRQPFVCGDLKSVVEYALKPNNGIEYFAEITNGKILKVSKKQLKELLNSDKLINLSTELFKKY